MKFKISSRPKLFDDHAEYRIDYGKISFITTVDREMNVSKPTGLFLLDKQDWNEVAGMIIMDYSNVIRLENVKNNDKTKEIRN